MSSLLYGAALMAALVAVVAWAFSKKRKSRFEKDARIPFRTDDD